MVLKCVMYAGGDSGGGVTTTTTTITTTTAAATTSTTTTYHTQKNLSLPWLHPPPDAINLTQSNQVISLCS